MHELDVSIRRLAVGVLPAKPAQVGDAQPDHQLARRGSDYPGFAALDSCCEIPMQPVMASAGGQPADSPSLTYYSQG